MSVEERIKKINDEINILNNVIDEKLSKCDFSSFKTFEEYENYTKNEANQIAKLSREKRLIISYELSEMLDYGDLMTLQDFIDCVKSGLFIDYDGYGYYVKDNMVSNIIIKPSDVLHNSIRKDFDKIVWLNR